MALCLNMIVKNEAPILERCLSSVLPWIDRYVVCDTGSTDGTPELVRKLLPGIPGEVPSIPFENFGQARNAALEAARSLSGPDDYLLLVDADMVLQVEDPAFRGRLSAHAYLVRQEAGISYPNVRLVKAGHPCRYVEPTHEYLDTGPMAERFEGIYFVDHADGSNRKEKFERDIRLLLADLKEHRGKPRSMFYLAQSYKDLGDLDAAIYWYEQRSRAGGWEEEAWYAAYMIAQCLERKSHPAFVQKALEAYQRRPQRIETLYLLARHFRIEGKHALAEMFALAGFDVPLPKDDMLFIEGQVYEIGMREELSITGFYSPHADVKAAARQACLELSVERRALEEPRLTAAKNSIYYSPLASEAFPSFRSVNVGEALKGDVYWPANPSVSVHADPESGWARIYCNVRMVNYAVPTTGGGAYTFRGNDVGDIKTTNTIVELDDELRILNQNPFHDSCPPDAGLLASAVKPHVLGYEDVRLFRWRDGWWASATVLDRNVDRRCEIALLELRRGHNRFEVVSVHVLAPQFDEEAEPRHEKNWMPCVRGDDLLFVYSLDPTIVLRVVDFGPHLTPSFDVRVAHRSETEPFLEAFRGGSQLVPWGEDEGYLALVHEAYEGEAGRRYLHRFVEFDRLLRVVRFSDPFRFLHTGIEFAAGLAWVAGRDISGDDLLVSFGVEDREAHVGRVSQTDIRSWLDRSVKPRPVPT